MSDPKLQAAGSVLLVAATVSLGAGIIGDSDPARSADIQSATSVALSIFAVFLVVGAVAWVLGRLVRTTSPEAANPRLRWFGFALIPVGLFIAVAGILGDALTGLGTLPRAVSLATVTVGLYLALTGTVLVAISHRRRVHRALPPVPQR
jgi:hypothetical protein